jgi:hypothetical protein
MIHNEVPVLVLYVMAVLLISFVKNKFVSAINEHQNY